MSYDTRELYDTLAEVQKEGMNGRRRGASFREGGYMTRRTVLCFQIVRKTNVFLVVSESVGNRRKYHKKTRCGNQSKVAWCILSFLARRVAMLIGYARVSKADGSQLLDLQRDALIEASVDAERIYGGNCIKVPNR